MAGEYLDPSQWPLWMQSGMMPTPPDAPYQPGDFQRAGPQMQRQGIGDSLRSLYEGMQNRDEQGIPQGPGFGAALSAAPGTGWLIGRAPKLTTAALAGYYGLSGTDPAGGAPKQQQATAAPPGNADDIKRLQEELRPYGYTGPIDGVWKGGTQRAYEAKQQADQQRIQQQGIEAQTAAANAQSAQAAAILKQSETQAEADRIKNEQRTQGQQRYNEAEAGISPVSRAIRDYAGPLGITAGLIAGPALRKMVTSGSDYMSQRAANTAANLQKRWPGTAPAQVARVNEIWRQGGQGEAVPFTSTPNTAPGFAANPNAAGMDKLFKPSTVGQRVADVTPMAVFGGEYAGASHFLHGAEDELVKATEAASSDPSDINIARMQKAKDNVALYTGFVRAGQAGGSSYAGAWAKMGRKPTIPNLSKAEAEKLNLEEMLRAGAMPIPPQAAPFLPQQAPQPRMSGKRRPWMRADNENALLDPLDFGYKR